MIIWLSRRFARRPYGRRGNLGHWRHPWPSRAQRQMTCWRSRPVDVSVPPLYNPGTSELRIKTRAEKLAHLPDTKRCGVAPLETAKCVDVVRTRNSGDTTIVTTVDCGVHGAVALSLSARIDLTRRVDYDDGDGGGGDDYTVGARAKCERSSAGRGGSHRRNGRIHGGGGGHHGATIIAERVLKRHIHCSC